MSFDGRRVESSLSGKVIRAAVIEMRRYALHEAGSHVFLTEKALAHERFSKRLSEICGARDRKPKLLNINNLDIESVIFA